MEKSREPAAVTNTSSSMTSREGFCSTCGRADETKKRKNDNGLYLNIIVGKNIDLKMSNEQRFEFKKDYEKFKLRVTLVNLVLLSIAFLFPSRPMDAICHFLMVWYYCTLTIRESILIINGSKMHWWWIAHHYIACVIGGVALTWPDDANYQSFRPQFILFAAYISFVQQLQYQYQSGCLRRLHALGKGDNMDVTLEGFASWMFSGLTFLLPFLAVAYIIELYNGYTLYTIWMQKDDAVWQVLGLSLLFILVGALNIFYVALTVLKKLSDNAAVRIQKLMDRYPFLRTLKKEN